MTKEAALKKLEESWRAPRYEGVIRPYRAEDVIRLRGSVLVEQTLAQRGAERLWTMLKQQKYIHALGALTGNQAVQQVKAGLKAIYLSGWQVAADANLSGQMYPDQSLYHEFDFFIEGNQLRLVQKIELIIQIPQNLG